MSNELLHWEGRMTEANVAVATAKHKMESIEHETAAAYDEAAEAVVEAIEARAFTEKMLTRQGVPREAWMALVA